MELAIESIEWSYTYCDAEMKRAWDNIVRINGHLTWDQEQLKQYTEQYNTAVNRKEELRKALEVLRAAK